MRIAVCALSAILLSGCSWFGDYGASGHGYNYGQSGGTYKAQHGNHAQGHYQQNGSYAGGFPQQPNFNGGYTTGGYGSHVSTAGQHSARHGAKPRIRKPKLRGSLSMGFEKSNSGNYLDYSKVPTLNPETGYDPDAYREVFNAPPPVGGDGTATSETYSAIIENIEKPDISFDDVHSTPFHLQAGLEYIASPHFTVFANAGYAYSEGEAGEAVRINGALTRRTSDQVYAMNMPVGMPTVNTTSIPNAGRIASFTYDFSDMERLDAEVGGRYYFNPVIKDQGHRTLTPFVSASAGVARYNAQSLTVGQQQAFYRENYEALTGTPAVGDDYQLTTYTVATPNTPVAVYDSGIVPKGALKAGMEWQVTRGAALALETGITYEGGRDYSNGEKGDANISVPLTLRGSFNF